MEEKQLEKRKERFSKKENLNRFSMTVQTKEEKSYTDFYSVFLLLQISKSFSNS